MSLPVQNEILGPEDEGLPIQDDAPETQGQADDEPQPDVEYEPVGQAMDSNAVNPPAPETEAVDPHEARAQAVELKAQATDFFKAGRYQEVT